MTTQEPKPAQRRWRLGPGLLVTAAFIGPGTVTTATHAGAQFGFALLWALLFAVAATVVLQEMAARVGLVARLGLADAIRLSIRANWTRYIALALVLLAIVGGNIAYQTGNLMGAGIGIHELTGLPVEVSAGLVGVGIIILLMTGNTERPLFTLLVGIVIAMSIAFVGAALMTRPDLAEMAHGATHLSLPKGSTIIAIALIGTTVVPYNLFLHATAVQQRWPKTADLDATLRVSRLDTVIAVGIGGLVTMAIVVTGAASFHANGPTLANLNEMSEQLSPLLGPKGSILFAAGLAAAGVTSSITAPLAAGYTVVGVFPKASPRWATVAAIGVVVVGALFAVGFGRSPHAAIVLAQATNGVLLPLVAGFLLLVMNRREMLGSHCNGALFNLLGGAVVLLTCGLAAKSLFSLICKT